MFTSTPARTAPPAVTAGRWRRSRLDAAPWRRLTGGSGWFWLAVVLFLPLSLRAQLVWDSVSKLHQVERGETNAVFRFHATNQTAAEIVVQAVRTSCHCTLAKLPPLPWKVAPGKGGEMEVDVDVTDRWGEINKTVTVETSHGTNVLQILVRMPELTTREKNRLSAFADRQAVFKLDCASCHLQPAVGKRGEELFKGACVICHEAEHRATMVPDLAQLRTPADEAYWRQWIRLGKPGTFMPAFSKPFGGPLTEDQIESLVAYLSKRYESRRPGLAPPAPAPAKLP